MFKVNRNFIGGIIISAAMMMTLCSCGSKEGMNIGGSTVSLDGDVLPKTAVITADPEDEHIDTIPAGEEPFFDRMFWGDWVRLDSDNEDKSSSKDKLKFELLGVDFSVECFPENFRLGTAGTGLRSENYEQEFDCGTFGIIGFNGDISAKKSSDMDIFQIRSAGLSMSGGLEADHRLKCVYHVSGDTLAFGLTDIMDEKKGDEISLFEIDYTFKWEGPFLTLYAGDKSMTYVSAFYKESNNQMLIDGAKRINESDEKNPLYSLKLTEEETQIEYKYDVPLNAQSVIHEDGTIELTDSLDRVHLLDIYYAGSTVTVVEDGKVCMLKNGKAGNYTEYFFNTMRTTIDSPGYVVGDDTIDSYLSKRVRRMLETGKCKIDVDSNYMVPSLQVVKFDGTYGNAKIHYKAINTYEKAAPLSECEICAETIDKDCGEIALKNGFSGNSIYVGKDDYYSAKQYSGSFYSANEKRIIYKVQVAGYIIGLNFDNPYGNRLIDRSFDGEVVFLFDNDQITEYSYEVPAYLYGGLQDNVDQGDLMSMSDSQINNALNLRDSVLAKLIEAFDTSGVNVEIEPSSGLVRMNNEILFDTGKYDVKPAGAEYINQVLGVISGVVLNSDVRDSIDKIEISGHCDPQGDYDSNYVLSVKRAESVKESFLTSNTGLSDSQKEQLSDLFVTEGYSFQNPIFNEDGNIDNDKSRRVEVKIFVNINAEAPSGSNNYSSTSPFASSSFNSLTSSYAGKMVGNSYVNDWFGYTFTAPNDWGFVDENSLFEANGKRTVEDAVEADDSSVFAMYAANNSDTEIVTAQLQKLEGFDESMYSEDSIHDIKKKLHEFYSSSYTSRTGYTEKVKEIQFAGKNDLAFEMEYIDNDGKQTYHTLIYKLHDGMLNVLHVISVDENKNEELYKLFSN